jgi:hypothetical protein
MFYSKSVMLSIHAVWYTRKQTKWCLCQENGCSLEYTVLCSISWRFPSTGSVDSNLVTCLWEGWVCLCIQFETNPNFFDPAGKIGWWHMYIAQQHTVCMHNRTTGHPMKQLSYQLVHQPIIQQCEYLSNQLLKYPTNKSSNYSSN